jgi:hypothetical protein
MKLVGIITTAALSLTLGVAAPVYAQQEQHDQQEEQKKTESDKSAKPAEKAAQQQDKNAKPEERKAQKQEEKSGQQEQQHAQQAKPEQQAQRGGNGGGRIPADRFKAHFGREHTFRVSQGDYRNHRFQYGGYWFGFVDPWPANWLYTQDVFVVDINGVYYLCNATYPGVNVALSFTL